MPVYVYGVVPAGAALDVRNPGVAGERVELVQHGGVAAVTSTFPGEDTRVRRRDLNAHLKTLETAFEQTTIAPCPFGTVLASREDVEAGFLAPRSEELQRLLSRLEGHVQMNVRAEYDETAILQEIVAEDRDVEAARDRAKELGAAAYYENIRLGELVSGRIAQRRGRDHGRISARLGALASDVVEDAADGGELLVFKGSLLVAKQTLPDFDAALDELAESEQGRIRFDAIGPLPPTAFATLEEAPSWA